MSKSYELRQSIVARVSPSLTNHIIYAPARQRVATVANLSRHVTSLVRHLFACGRPRFRTPAKGRYQVSGAMVAVRP